MFAEHFWLVESLVCTVEMIGPSRPAGAGRDVRRLFARCCAVGTRSRAIRGSTSDDRVGCSASHGRCAPARPALHVSTRVLPFLPRALASADRPFPLLRPSVNALRRTRRKPSTIKGAPPDVVIGQSTAARAGARPYRRRRSGSVLALLLRLRRASAAIKRISARSILHPVGARSMGLQSAIQS